MVELVIIKYIFCDYLVGKPWYVLRNPIEFPQHKNKHTQGKNIENQLQSTSSTILILAKAQKRNELFKG